MLLTGDGRGDNSPGDLSGLINEYRKARLANGLQSLGASTPIGRINGAFDQFPASPNGRVSTGFDAVEPKRGPDLISTMMQYLHQRAADKAKAEGADVPPPAPAPQAAAPAAPMALAPQGPTPAPDQGPSLWQRLLDMRSNDGAPDPYQNTFS